jgi:hypothetical protein
MRKVRIVFIVGITLLPFLAYSEGQDWMMSVDNGLYFLKLLFIYCVASLATFWGARKILKKKFKFILFLLAALVISIIHWEATKQKPVNRPIEKYLNSTDIDTTKAK